MLSKSKDFRGVSLSKSGKWNPETFKQLVEGIEKHLEELGKKNLLDDVLGFIKLFFFPYEPIDDSKLQLEKFLKVLINIQSPEILYILNRIMVTLLWNEISKPPTMLAGHTYRSADGSDYSKFRTSIEYGVAGSRYARSARMLKPLEVFPDATDVFNSVMKRTSKKKHPAGISGMLTYLAILITHDLFNSKHEDRSINLTSSYLDLTSLYGSDKEQQKSVRLFKRGLLRPDTFADDRILIQPPGVGALLILFARNHNYIARRLLEINERGRFSLDDKTNLLKQDEELFQTARLINCGAYFKVIIHNYIHTILGIDRTKSPWYINITEPYNKSLFLLPPVPTGVGNQVSLEFNYIYRWHPAITNEDEQIVRQEFKDILGRDDPENISVDEFKKKFREWKMGLPKEPSEWTIGDIERGEDGSYKDSDIARILIEGTKWTAGAFGARRIPDIFRVIEISGIESARATGVCSLNDFRRFLNLAPYKSFESMTPDKEVASELKRLYGDIENVELYPGLMTENTKPADVGSAFALPYTISHAILTDATNLVRNDRFLTDDYNPYNLTSWGWKEFQSDPNDLAEGGILNKVIQNNVPGIYKENSVWSLLPFTTPEQSKANLKARGADLSLYDFDEPITSSD